MDKLLGLLSGLEQAIRYLLTGAVISGIVLMSLHKPDEVLVWAGANLVLGAVFLVVIGATAYTVYRVIFWVIVDRIAWCRDWSAPALRKDLQHYSSAYAWFLRWRYANKFTEALSRYLWYRWAAAHLVLLSGLVLVFAVFLSADKSCISEHPVPTFLCGLLGLGLGIQQCYFLFRVERALCEEDENPSHKKIALTAYYLWQSAGCPEGQSKEHWRLAAEKLMSEQKDTPATECWFARCWRWITKQLGRG